MIMLVLKEDKERNPSTSFRYFLLLYILRFSKAQEVRTYTSIPTPSCQIVPSSIYERGPPVLSPSIEVPKASTCKTYDESSKEKEIIASSSNQIIKLLYVRNS
ncbi:uncharacterized protein [Palaemon carinicauda]|uniref:uncharacterized protein n=1 Tax=Palaemon carinicauda TaxID=392227 RepID=UPI0035B67CD8